jgi:hypothetical protein
MPAFLVQLRFPGDHSWVTVAVAGTRAIAATYAGAAYANATNEAGLHANQVRILEASGHRKTRSASRAGSRRDTGERGS